VKAKEIVSKTGFGRADGETCWRNGCKGVIEEHCHDKNCYCHISPPCASCMTDRAFCPVCDWVAADDHGIINDYAVKYADRSQGVLATWKPRPLDPRKIDWRTKAHTNSSQICVGVYPEGTTRAEVENLVAGTFGGRFNHFGCGTFEYVAYTD
jgi:hypothetical protein